MKRVLLLSFILCAALSVRAQSAAPEAAPVSFPQRVTLYGPLAHGYDASRALFSFKTGAYGQNWDLNYGSLYVSEEHDWFQVSTLPGARTAIRDLGPHGWADSFEVPVVEPFPELKEGEQRRIVVNADGADGMPGRSAGPRGEASLMESPIPREDFPPIGAIDNTADPNFVEPLKLSPRRRAPGPRRDGVPKVDPIFARAVVGHIYAVHVVDAGEDFYVLFRVESLVRGDNCTITWKRVPAQSTGSSEVTLYSPIKYGPSFERAFFNFQTGSTTTVCCRWDLAYGTLSVGKDHDWLQVAASTTTRTAIKDLGTHSWNDSFQIPVVEPFPQLKEGEQRLVVVNADGADGKPARPTHPKPLPGPLPPSWEEPRSETWLLHRQPAPPPPAPPRPVTPPTSPIFARAVVGHVYAVHVVDEGVDYYALFRVESLASGDHCTISWKMIPSPVSEDHKQKK